MAFVAAIVASTIALLLSILAFAVGFSPLPAIFGSLLVGQAIFALVIVKALLCRSMRKGLGAPVSLA